MKDHKEYLDMWNDNHLLLIRKRNTTMAELCENLIVTAKEAYYNGSPIMEDKTYDWFEDRLRILNPDSKILDKVGS